MQPSYKWHLGKSNEDEFISKKAVFLRRLQRFMQDDWQIIYLDETSPHLWEKRSKVWMPRDKPIFMRLNAERGKSRTLFGAISNRWNDMEYGIRDKTNAINFCDFLKMICIPRLVENPRRTVIILDNHAAHKSKKARNLADKLGISFYFLPPTASELNPIERMWSYFKVRWRFHLSDHNNRVNPGNIDHHLEICLDAVKSKVANLGKGPLRQMVMANMLEFPELGVDEA